MNTCGTCRWYEVNERAKKAGRVRLFGYCFLLPPVPVVYPERTEDYRPVVNDADKACSKWAEDRP